MTQFRRYAVLFMAIVTLGGAAMISGCTSYATQEQLDRIRQLEREISSLEASIQNKQSQIGSLDRQISATDAKLDQCAKDKQLVKQRLANWKGM
ncbi:MAG: hypothetical protein QHI48_04205 [Bacteroidota bacterium]|nr:hypothetical protein [Bacteroidota bacterium]